MPATQPLLVKSRNLKELELNFSARLAQEAEKATSDNAFVKLIVNGFAMEVTSVSVVNAIGDSHGGIDAKTRDDQTVLINVDSIDALILPADEKPYLISSWGGDQHL